MAGPVMAYICLRFVRVCPVKPTSSEIVLFSLETLTDVSNEPFVYVFKVDAEHLKADLHMPCRSPAA
jgi:hypothetical protein